MIAWMVLDPSTHEAVGRVQAVDRDEAVQIANVRYKGAHLVQSAISWQAAKEDAKLAATMIPVKNFQPPRRVTHRRTHRCEAKVEGRACGNSVKQPVSGMIQRFCPSHRKRTNGSASVSQSEPTERQSPSKGGA